MPLLEVRKVAMVLGYTAIWLLSRKKYLKGTKSVSPQPADGNCREFDWDMESHASFLD
jgi:hypothetical protein